MKTIHYWALTLCILFGAFNASGLTVKSGNGLALEIRDDGSLAAVTVNGVSLPLTGAPQFQVREVTAGVSGSVFRALKPVKAAPEGESVAVTAAGEAFEITAKLSPDSAGVRLNTIVRSAERRDRALVLRWVLPVDCTGWQWSGGLGEERPITAGGNDRFGNFASAKVRIPEAGGVNSAQRGGIGNGSYGDAVGMGEFSPYPLACVISGKAGIGAGIDLNRPVMARLLALPGQGIAIEFDLGISPHTFKFPSAAELSWIVFGVDPVWGFRSAIERYSAMHPASFEKRVKKEGIWMPFTAITDVPDFQDFGFMFHETSFRPARKPGEKTIADIDREIGVYSFVYVEPWDIQIAAQKEGPTYDASVSAAYPSGSQREQILRSITFDPFGQWMIRAMEAPWFKTGWALSYTTNPDPDLGRGSRFDQQKSTVIDPALQGGMDGVYFDSWEYFWPMDLNYRVDHMNTADYPLCFSSSLEKPRPAVWHYASEYEMGKAIADDLHANGKLAMGNGFYNIPFTAGIMDLFGCEFSWPGRVSERKERWAYFRTMAGAKPIVVLLNRGMYSDAFMKEPYEGYTVYMNETLFWGVYPSFFSPNASSDPYWKNPKAMEIGRPFFKKFIPLIREVASAGWQPVTRARMQQEALSVERFGPGSDGAVYFTIRSLEDLFDGGPAEIVIESGLFPTAKSLAGMEITSGEKVRLSRKGSVVTGRIAMKKGETKVLRVNP
jgi:hypothetical protein